VLIGAGRGPSRMAGDHHHSSPGGHPRSSLAENLSYSPWHALKEHEPVGAINRARLPVYEQMARLRHEMNGICRRAPQRYPALNQPGNAGPAPQTEGHGERSPKRITLDSRILRTPRHDRAAANGPVPYGSA